MKDLWIAVVAMVFVFGAFVMVGCSGDTGGRSQRQAPAEAQSGGGPADSGEEIAQTTCPVMGGEINKDIYVEHEGRRVYFCCPGCPETFKENPEKYLSNLESRES
mgnify:CR=1 FL=1